MLPSITICLLALASTAFGAGKPKLDFAWKQMTFDWPSEEFKQKALNISAYIPENNLPVGLAVWRDKLFLTIPRWRNGVASSLNYIQIGDSVNSTTPSLIPYPSWEENYIEDVTKGLRKPSTVASVFRIWVDKCDRLWVMDTGVTDILGETTSISDPALVIFDLETDTFIRRHVFEKDVLKSYSFLANVVVDVEVGKCNEAFAYVPDLSGNGLIVYDFAADKSWRVEHHYFHFDPLNGEYEVEGIEFRWTDGVFGVAIGAPIGDNTSDVRNVMFHPFSGIHEFSVLNTVLKNETFATDKKNNFFQFEILGKRGDKSQASASYYDEKLKVLFYTQVNLDGIACWKSTNPLKPETTELIIHDSKEMVFPNDIKIGDDGVLWILSDRLPKFMYSKLDSNEINYRIFSISAAEAVKNTRCG